MPEKAVTLNVGVGGSVVRVQEVHAQIGVPPTDTVVEQQVVSIADQNGNYVPWMEILDRLTEIATELRRIRWAQGVIVQGDPDLPDPDDSEPAQI